MNANERIWLSKYGPGCPHTLTPPELTLDQLFDQTVSRHADKLATVFSIQALGRLFTKSITFRELDRLSDRFAAALQKRGVVKGDRVALFMPNCPQFVIGYVGALKAGAVAVPVNPLYSPREAAFQLNDCGAKVVLVLSRFYPIVRKIQEQTKLEHVVVTRIKDYFPLTLRTLFTLTQEKKEGHRVKIDRAAKAVWLDEIMEDAIPSRPEVSLDDTAVLLYSGGTTGISKGVVLSHRNLVTNAYQNGRWAMMRDGEERILAALPLFHAFGLTCCLNFACMSGNTMLLIPNPRDIAGVVMTIDRFKATLFPIVPTLMVAISNFAKIDRFDLKSVRVAPCAGAPLAEPVYNEFFKKTGIAACEGYGLTEASPTVIANPPHAENRLGTIGIPYPDTDARILSLETGEPVGFEEGATWSEAGELEVRGPQVMRGYWQRPDETALHLRDGWLRTGDIAQVSRDGYFRIVDRKKDMIIRGGMNVYPTEIEAVLYDHPQVKEALVIGVPDQERGELVKAFVTLKPGATATPEVLRTYCKENLAKYKVPSFIELRAELPRSAVGKLLRRALREEIVQKAAGAEGMEADSSAAL